MIIKIPMSRTTVLSSSHPSLGGGLWTFRPSGSEAKRFNSHTLLQSLLVLPYCSIRSVRCYHSRLRSSFKERQRSQHLSLSSGTAVDHCLAVYNHSRWELRGLALYTAIHLIRSRKPKAVSVGRDLMYWISREPLKYEELNRFFGFYNRVSEARRNKVSEIERRISNHQSYCDGPFNDARAISQQIILQMNYEQDHSPRSYVSVSLRSAYPTLDHRDRYTFHASSLLKNSIRQLLKDMGVFGDYHMAHQRNIFLQESWFWKRVLDNYLSSQSAAYAKFEEWKQLLVKLLKQQQPSSILFMTQWPKYLAEIVTAHNILVISRGSLKACLRPYLECVSERMSFYDEMSQKHPEDIPIMKSYMVSPGKIKAPSFSQIQKIHNHISDQEVIIQRIKEQLLKLGKYLTQLEDPKIAPHQRRSLGEFLAAGGGQQPFTIRRVKGKRQRASSLLRTTNGKGFEG